MKSSPPSRTRTRRGPAGDFWPAPSSGRWRVPELPAHANAAHLGHCRRRRTEYIAAWPSPEAPARLATISARAAGQDIGPVQFMWWECCPTASLCWPRHAKFHGQSWLDAGYVPFRVPRARFPWAMKRSKSRCLLPGPGRDNEGRLQDRIDKKVLPGSAPPRVQLRYHGP